MNPAHIEPTGWESHVNNPNNNWGSNIISNVVTARTQTAPYNLLALPVFSDTRLITNDLTDTMIYPITREIFTDPILASDGNNYERIAITTGLTGNHYSTLTNKHLDTKTLHSNITVQNILMNIYERTPQKVIPCIP